MIFYAYSMRNAKQIVVRDKQNSHVSQEEPGLSVEKH